MSTARKKLAKEILQEARALIAKGWTKGAFARDEKGEAVSPHDASATCFCMLGAFHRVEGPIAPGARVFASEGSAALATLGKTCAWVGFVTANDDAATVDVVLGYFDEAIALLSFAPDQDGAVKASS